MIIKNRYRKKPRDEAMEIMFEELKGMIRAFVICNAVVLAGCAVLILTGLVSLQWQLFTGLLVGNAAALLNFYHLGVKAGNIMRRKDASHARRYASFSFFARYLGAFAVFGLLIHFNVISVYTAVIPLFYPRIHYTVKAIKNKEV